MEKELSLGVVQSQMSSTQKLLVGEETIDEINKLAKDPQYGEQFLECYLDHLNIYKELPGRSHRQYLSAVKFFSLVEAGNDLTDAYIKVFPDRYDTRQENTGQEESGKRLMRGEASRYNASMMVNEIRRVATVPIQLVHRHLLHEAIIETAELARNAKSEMVRQKSWDTLIRELKPQEDHVVSVKVDDGTTSAIDQLHKAAERLAAAEYQSVQAGVPLKEIAESVILTVHEEESDEPSTET